MKDVLFLIWVVLAHLVAAVVGIVAVGAIACLILSSATGQMVAGAALAFVSFVTVIAYWGNGS